MRITTVSHELFQSTLPAWGETRPHPSRKLRRNNFNPLSPHGERPATVAPSASWKRYFNPLSPHGERRHGRCGSCRRPVYFNPLSPHGERRQRPQTHRSPNKISIHSPRMGRDLGREDHFLSRVIFQSTLPAWGETLGWDDGHGYRIFQSTLPAWGET